MPSYKRKCKRLGHSLVSFQVKITRDIEKCFREQTKKEYQAFEALSRDLIQFVCNFKEKQIRGKNENINMSNVLINLKCCLKTMLLNCTSNEVTKFWTLSLLSDLKKLLKSSKADASTNFVLRYLWTTILYYKLMITMFIYISILALINEKTKTCFLMTFDKITNCIKLAADADDEGNYSFFENFCE